MASTDASPGADNYDQMQADAYEDEGSGTPGSRKLKNTSALRTMTCMSSEC